jgi:hypothetical protein
MTKAFMVTLASVTLISFMFFILIGYLLYQTENMRTDNATAQLSNSSIIRTGVKGTVYFIGSECPPTASIRVPPCSGPFPGYNVEVYDEDGTTLVKRVMTDAMGKFTVSLEPGHYIIYTQAGPFPSHKLANEIVVNENQVVEKDLNIDTGIR